MTNQTRTAENQGVEEPALERIAAAPVPLSCAEAKEALCISPATLSHHIKELEAAGLVHVEREGKFIYLSLKSEVWSSLVASLTSIGQAHPARS